MSIGAERLPGVGGLQPFAFTLYMASLLYLTVSSPVPQTPDPDLFLSVGGFMLRAVLAAYFLAGGWLI